jgi:hypothetical protein
VAFLLGDAITDYVTLRDAAGALLVGSPPTVAVQVAPAGGSFGTITITETATAGTYSIAFTPSGAAGQYYLALTNPLASPKNYAETYDVDPVAGTSGVSVVSTTGTTLLQLYRDVADELGDLTTLTLTANGDTATLYDAVNLVGPNNAYQGRQAYFVSGTVLNVGLVRTVQGSSQSASSASLRPVLPASTTTGDVVDLIDDRGQGWTRRSIVAAINRGIRAAQRTHLVELVSDLAAPVASPTGWSDATVAIPVAMAYVTGVEYEDESGNFREIVPQYQRYGDGYRIDAPNATVVLGPPAVYALGGRDARLRGYGLPAELAADADRTTVNDEWLVANACAQLLWQAANFDRMPGADGRAMQWQRRADSLRARVRTIPAANAVKVR